jgi:site-specific recombinase XerD
MTFAWRLDERKFLTLDKVRRLRSHCRREKARALRKKEFLGVRDWFLIELGLNTGLRVQELSDLRCGDLLISEDEASLIVRKGKGNKRRPVWLSQSFKESAEDFLAWKRRREHAIDAEAPLLTSEQGERVTKRALQKAFKRIMQQAGLESHYSIHSLRHTYGTHLLKAGGYNLRLVQEQLGHSSVRITEVYTKLIGSDVKQALGKLYR